MQGVPVRVCISQKKCVMLSEKTKHYFGSTEADGVRAAEYRVPMSMSGQMLGACALRDYKSAMRPQAAGVIKSGHTTTNYIVVLSGRYGFNVIRC